MRENSLRFLSFQGINDDVLLNLTYIGGEKAPAKNQGEKQDPGPRIQQKKGRVPCECFVEPRLHREMAPNRAVDL